MSNNKLAKLKILDFSEGTQDTDWELVWITKRFGSECEWRWGIQAEGWGKLVAGKNLGRAGMRASVVTDWHEQGDEQEKNAGVRWCSGTERRGFVQWFKKTWESKLRELAWERDWARRPKHRPGAEWMKKQVWCAAGHCNTLGHVNIP